MLICSKKHYAAFTGRRKILIMPGSLFTVGVPFSSHNLFWQIMAQYSIEISQKQRKREKMGKIQKFKQKNGISNGIRCEGKARSEPE